MKKTQKNDGVVEQLKHFFATAKETYLPHLSIDSVIFGFHESRLKVLLVRFGETEHFVLPGGFIKFRESIDDAAARILEERTGLQDVFLEQFYTSGSLLRSDKTVTDTLARLVGDLKPGHFLDGRFVSVCYYALIEYSDGGVRPGIFDVECRWMNIDEVPPLLFDHNEIVEKAVIRLREDLDRKLVGFRLLKEPFTMNELQDLYEAIHQKSFLRANFQRRMLGLNILRRMEKKYTGQSNKAPYTYSFETRTMRAAGYFARTRATNFTNPETKDKGSRGANFAG